MTRLVRSLPVSQCEAGQCLWTERDEWDRFLQSRNRYGTLTRYRTCSHAISRRSGSIDPGCSDWAVCQLDIVGQPCRSTGLTPARVVLKPVACELPEAADLASAECRAGYECAVAKGGLSVSPVRRNGIYRRCNASWRPDEPANLGEVGRFSSICPSLA